jgi:hypothetical protein
VEADGANYQLEMMRCLREVNVDNNTVGWYSFLNIQYFLSFRIIPCIRWRKSSDVRRVGVPCLLLRVIKALSERHSIDVISKALYQTVDFTLMEIRS